MASFCTIADLADFLRIVIAADDRSAVRAIEATTSEIQGYTRQQLELVTDDVVALDGNGAVQLLLPEWPAKSVSSVKIGGILLDPQSYALKRSGILYRIGSIWPAGFGNVQVTYSHGYSVIPAEVVDVCVRAAARSYQAGLRSEAVGGIAGVSSEQLADHTLQLSTERGNDREWALGASAAPILLASEERVLNRYKSKRLT